MPNLCCPNCNQPLSLQGRSLVCKKSHSFDQSKSGYVNLLLPNKMNSKAPGDNKIMVDTRNEFLSKGYYSPLMNALCKEVLALVMSSHKEKVDLLDAGCGEGYYTSAMAQALAANNLHADILGVDISKLALNIAAKRTTQVQFCVASVFDIPIPNNSCDIVTELFAPYCGEEIYRVLKKDGIFLLVIPSQEHLYELKQAVYQKPYKNEVKDYNLDGFELLKKTEVFSEMIIDNQEDIKNLFMMTPYSYKTSKDDMKRLLELHSLKTKIQFELLCYRVVK